MIESQAIRSRPTEDAAGPQTAAGKATKARLNGVEAARGVAALLVVFYHAALHVEGNVGGTVLWHLPHFGHAGVDFFFVLSGFIIAYVHHQDIGRADRLGHYVRRRFTRVLPFYWIVLAYYLADAWLFHPAHVPGKWGLVSNILLLPQSGSQIVGGAWTLVFELMFYTIFAVMICSKRAGSVLLGLWAALVAAGFVVHLPPVLVASSPFCLEFFLGMGAAYVLLHHRIAGGRAILLIGVLGFAAAGLSEVAGLLNGFGALARVAYGTCSLLIILALVELERSGMLRVPKPLAILGRASYAVYLVHLIGVGIGFHYISRLIHLTPADALPLWLALCVIGVAAGILASIWVEQPVIRWSRRRLDQWLSPGVVAVAGE